MNLFSLFEKEKKEIKKPFFSATFAIKKDKLTYNNQLKNLKGKKLKDFTEKIGGSHLENYDENNLIFKDVPLAKRAIAKKASYVASDIPRIISDNKKMEEAGNELMSILEEKDITKKISLDMHKYGNCFLEIVSSEEYGVLNFAIWRPQRMYVHKDKHGIIDEYIQSNELEVSQNFAPKEMAHFKLDAEDEDDYGLSDIQSIRMNLNFKLALGKDMNVIVSRKANAPYVVTVGSKEDFADEDTITKIKESFSTMGSKTEWIFSHLVKVENIGFEGKIMDVKPYIDEFERQIKFGLGVPDVLLGEGNIAEGLANKQMEDFWIGIREERKSIKTTLRKKIFDLHFELLGFNINKEKYNIVWESESEDENLKKIGVLTPLLKPDVVMTDSTKIVVENKIRHLLGVEEEVGEDDLPKKEEEPEKEEKTKKEKWSEANTCSTAPIVGDEYFEELSGVIDKENKKTKEQYIIELSKRRDNLKENFLFLDANPMTIEALTGLDVSKFKENTLDFLDKYNFKVDGKSIKGFGKNDTEDLRGILKNGIRNDKSIANIEKNVEGISALQKEEKKVRKIRATNIARTEIVRATNTGSLQMYKDSGLVKKVEFLSAGSSRTCATCIALNGSIYTIEESRAVIPIHVNCRCSFLPILEKEKPMEDKKERDEKELADTFKERKDRMLHYYKTAHGKDYAKKIYPINFNDDEALSVYLYSMGFFEDLNKQLRKGKKIIGNSAKIDKVLAKAIHKLPISKKVFIERRVSFYSDQLKDFDNLIKNIKENKKIVMDSYISATSDATVKGYFGSNTTSGHLVDFKIKHKTGREIAKISSRPGEKEVLLNKGMSYKINKIEVTKERDIIGKRAIITMEEI